MKSKYLLVSFIFVIVVALFHFIGGAHGLYYSISWYDNVPHFFAGLSIGFFAMWFWRMQYPANVFYEVVFVVMTILLVAISWELFELASGITYLSMVTPAGLSYGADTTKDILVGFSGAIVALFAARF
ncbi:hypothetical protein EB052_00480 [bacterium]|nr:hypothetical protein [bacterium]